MFRKSWVWLLCFEGVHQVLDASFDENKTRDRDRGLLSLDADDALVQDARRDAEAGILKAAENNDILQQAETNAENSIRAFVTTLGFEEVRFQ